MKTPTKSKEKEKALSKPEAQKFTKLDGIIKSGAKTFMEVGNALVDVHKGKLYREKFKTFEAYCASRGIKRRSAYQLMTAVQVSLSLENVQHAAQSSVRTLNKLATVPPKKQKEVFEKAAAKAGGPPTEGEIIEAKAEVIPPDAPIEEPAPEIHPEPPDEPTPAESQVEVATEADAKAAIANRNGMHAWPLKDDVAKPFPSLTNKTKSGDEKPLTPVRFLDELLSLEKRIPADLPQKEREKYGIHANALASRLMNPLKKNTSAYTS